MTFLWTLLALYTLTCAWLCYSGPFTEVYWEPMAWLLRKIGMAAITFGRYCFVRERAYLPLPEQNRKHEQRHTWQWRVLFVLFPPLYLFLLAWQGYGGNFLENDARRAAGEPLR